ncbi:MAG: hypothetical protein JO010_02685 [Alphaproteobacteria bacterium]|nr:hypothetical protein [Alphaproteobacteria bacterium]
MSEFETNLMRMIAAELWLANRLQVAREFLGKSYLSLSAAEKTVVDQLVFGALASDYQTITPEWLQAQKVQQPMGFQAQGGTPLPIP